MCWRAHCRGWMMQTWRHVTHWKIVYFNNGTSQYFNQVHAYSADYEGLEEAFLAGELFPVGG